MVGKGRLRRSHILFSIPQEVRQSDCEDGRWVCPEGVSPHDFEVVRLYGDAGHAMGDMYDQQTCEKRKRRRIFIKERLVRQHGDSELRAAA